MCWHVWLLCAQCPGMGEVVFWVVLAAGGVALAARAYIKSVPDPLVTLCREAEVDALCARARELRKQVSADPVSRLVNITEASMLERKADRVCQSLAADMIVVRLTFAAAVLWAAMCAMFAVASLV